MRFCDPISTSLNLKFVNHYKARVGRYVQLQCNAKSVQMLYCAALLRLLQDATKPISKSANPDLEVTTVDLPANEVVALSP